jgi:Amt family ammonium transporter
VRRNNQVNALVKILVDFAVSTTACFFVGHAIACGVTFSIGAEALVAKNGVELVKFFVLLTFAAAIPAIVSAGIAERARFGLRLMATAVLVGPVYPLFDGVGWAALGGFVVYGGIKAVTGLRLSGEVEYHGADLSIHRIGATPDREVQG